LIESTPVVLLSSVLLSTSTGSFEKGIETEIEKCRFSLRR
jgi:hypothetical protein